ncbi:hypothetical protein [Pseudoalteromonas phage vB_PtuP_Slicky01]|nr:hypothetical protein [Pseudoalteromonas phage vB_PtuP_Slicky01]
MLKLFTADWCANCKGLKKLLDSLDVAYEVIDVDKESEEAMKLNIRALPTLYCPETQRKLIGNVTKQQLEEFIS